MTQIQTWGPFWGRTLKVHGTRRPIWFGRTTQTEGSYRSSIHPVVQYWPGRAVAFGIWGRKHTEHAGLLLAMRSIGKTRIPRSEVINEGEDAVQIARRGRDLNADEAAMLAAQQTGAVRRVVDLTTHEGIQQALKQNTEQWMRLYKSIPLDNRDEEM